MTYSNFNGTGNVYQLNKDTLDFADMHICGCRVIMFKQPPRPYVIMKVWFPPNKGPIEMVHEIIGDIPTELWFEQTVEDFKYKYIESIMQQKLNHLHDGGLVH